MNELIKVTYDNDRPAVSARDLHEFLEVDTPYHKWFPRMCGYGFTENEDFMVTDNFVPNSAGGPQHQKDAILSIDMAKELCMIQRNERESWHGSTSSRSRRTGTAPKRSWRGRCKLQRTKSCGWKPRWKRTSQRCCLPML